MSYLISAPAASAAVTRPMVKREQHFLSSTTWTAPALLVPGSLVATVISGGNSGCVGPNSSTVLGGNGGGIVIQRPSDVAPGSTQTVTVGAGGTSGAVAGTSVGSYGGGSSRFGSVVSRTGSTSSAPTQVLMASEGGGQVMDVGNARVELTDSILPPYSGAGAGVASSTRLNAGRGGGIFPRIAPMPNSGGGGAAVQGENSGSAPGAAGRVIIVWEEYPS